MRDRTRLMGLVVLEVALVFALHALGRLEGFAIDWSDPVGWLDTVAFEDAVGAIVLMVALVMAYWLLLSTLAYLAASMSGRPGTMGAVGWLTLPPVRRLVRRAVALSIAASAVAGPLAPAVANLTGGAGSVPVVIEVDEAVGLHAPVSPGAPADEDRFDIVVPPHLDPRPPPIITHEPERSPGSEPSVDGLRSHSVVVRRGDHLWSLSERHLAQVLGRSDLGEHEIARYWVRVIETNRDAIRSGNADLIYPGEVIELPAVTPSP